MNEGNLMDDILGIIIDSPMKNIDLEYYEIEEKFFAIFKHRVPREMLPDAISQDEIKRAMQVCIQKGTDTLYEELGVEIDYNKIY